MSAHNRGHDVADEPVSGRVDRELAVLQSAQPAAVRADPQAVIAAFGERPDLVFLQLLLVAVVERRESHAVEARQAALRADPEIRIAGLKQAENGVLRESLRLPPDLDGMNRRLLCGLACAGAFARKGMTQSIAPARRTNRGRLDLPLVMMMLTESSSPSRPLCQVADELSAS